MTQTLKNFDFTKGVIPIAAAVIMCTAVAGWSGWAVGISRDLGAHNDSLAQVHAKLDALAATSAVVSRNESDIGYLRTEVAALEAKVETLEAYTVSARMALARRGLDIAPTDTTNP